MLRRRHKKSKGGCLPCKERHVKRIPVHFAYSGFHISSDQKCDEGRPVCLLCTISHRNCSYAASYPPRSRTPSNPATISSHSSLSPQIHHQSIKSSNNQSVDSWQNKTKDSTTTTPLPNSHLLRSLPNVNPHQHPHTDIQDRQDQPGLLGGGYADLNINHMELIIHLISDNDVVSLSLAEIDLRHHIAFPLVLKKGLEYPYLLHEMLAFSSLHMASMHPAKSIFYQHQAMALQTRAISLFNSHWTEIDETNCVSILLFSSVLGHHLLADTLANQNIGNLDFFMANYLHCVEIHRGIHTLAMSAWPQLIKSELEPILSASSRFTSRSPRGNDCEGISGLISASQGLGDEDKEACQLVIRHLQIGFDAVSTELGQGYRHYMIYTWLMLAPSRYIDLLSTKKPEALILLAFYAVLLHHGRHLWQVKNAGIYILRMINKYLDPVWHHWLQYPRRIMAQDLQ